MNTLYTNLKIKNSGSMLRKGQALSTQKVVNGYSGFIVSFILCLSLLIPVASATAQSNKIPAGAIELTNNANNIQSGKVYYCKGSFTGNINSMPSTAKIYVDEKANFAPSNMNNAAGEIINYSTASFGGLSINNTLTVSNYGTLTFNNDLNTNGKAFKLNNYASGTATFRRGVNTSNGFTVINHGLLTFESNLNMNGFTVITNGEYGKITFKQNFKLQNGSEMTNNGDLEFLAELTTDNGTKLVNNGYLETINNNYNLNLNGFIENNGMFLASGFINMNSNMEFINKCTLVAGKGFNNNGKLVNYAFVLAQPNAGNAGTTPKVQNNSNGHIVMADAAALVEGADFTNNGTVSGIGKFYFTGTTVNQGTFAAKASDNISFYDSSSKSTTNGFDTDSRSAKIASSRVSSYTTEKYIAECATCSEPVRARYAPIAPLPVELVNFKANKDSKGRALLTWNTASEDNNDRFEVERSANGTEWQKIGQVAGAGNSSVNRSYSFTDLSTSGTAYYRLKQVDFDGQYEYSKVVVLESQVVKAQQQINRMYYNPSATALEITYSNISGGSLEVIVVSIDGKVLVNKKVALNDSHGIVSVPVDANANGMFVAKAATGNVYQSTKFVK